MSAKNNGGPAFPGWAMENTKEASFKEGMALRDWLAGMALARVINVMDKEDDQPTSGARELAQAAYMMADAMLEAREQ